MNDRQTFLEFFDSPFLSSLEHLQLPNLRLEKITLASKILQAAEFPGEHPHKTSLKMPSSTHLTLSLLTLSPLAALARTDFSGCTSFTSTVTVNPTAHEYGNVYGSVMYYDPDTLEICTVPDCGGGRAPPKTGVPGCPLYSGTATVTPSFLSADPLATTVTTSSAAAETTTAAPSSGDVESSSSSSSTSVVVVTGTDGSANATGGSGTAQATRSSTVVQGSSTGSATGAPTASADASSGAASRVAIGGLSGVLGLFVAFLL